MLEQGVTATNPEFTIVQILQGGHFFFRKRDQNLGLFNIGVQTGTFLCQGYTLGVPIKQGKTKALFQLLDGMTDAGLSDIQCFRSLCQTSRFGRPIKDFI
ncbi:hypothetical protein D3C74_460210 [compost metagenome]